MPWGLARGVGGAGGVAWLVALLVVVAWLVALLVVVAWLVALLVVVAWLVALLVVVAWLVALLVVVVLVALLVVVVVARGLARGSWLGSCRPARGRGFGGDEVEAVRACARRLPCASCYGGCAAARGGKRWEAVLGSGRHGSPRPRVPWPHGGDPTAERMTSEATAHLAPLDISRFELGSGSADPSRLGRRRLRRRLPLRGGGDNQRLRCRKPLAGFGSPLGFLSCLQPVKPLAGFRRTPCLVFLRPLFRTMKEILGQGFLLFVVPSGKFLFTEGIRLALGVLVAEVFFPAHAEPPSIGGYLGADSDIVHGKSSSVCMANNLG